MIPIKYTLQAKADGKAVDLIAGPLTHILVTMPSEHAHIHEGEHFFIAGYDTLDAAEDADFQVITPNSQTWAHMTFYFQTTGATTIKVYEGAAVALDGTPLTAYNSNRNSANTSVLTIQLDGTVNTAGTLIYSQAWGATNVPSQLQGGLSSRSNEMILRAGTTYRFFVESDSAGNIVSYNGEWYEHQNKE